MNQFLHYTNISKYASIFIFSCTLLAQDQNDLKQSLIQASADLRQIAFSPQSTGYQKNRNSALSNKPLNLEALQNLLEDSSLTGVQRRLAEIWQAKTTRPQAFNTVAPYGKAVAIDSTQALILSGRQVPNQDRRINIARFSLELLHPDLVAATETHPEIYQMALEMGKDIRKKASLILSSGGRDFQSLSTEYADRMASMLDLAEGRRSKMATIRNIIAAAQPPIFGSTYPPSPRLNPEFLLAWEELTMQSTDQQLKCKLVYLICEIDPIATMPCLGMVLQQILAAWKEDIQTNSLLTLYANVLDHFRDHPSRTAAIVLSEAIAYGQSGKNPITLPVGSRLESPQWQAVLRSLDNDPGNRDHAARLRQARQPPK